MNNRHRRTMASTRLLDPMANNLKHRAMHPRILRHAALPPRALVPRYPPNKRRFHRSPTPIQQGRRNAGELRDSHRLIILDRHLHIVRIYMITKRRNTTALDRHLRHSKTRRKHHPNRSRGPPPTTHSLSTMPNMLITLRLPRSTHAVLTVRRSTSHRRNTIVNRPLTNYDRVTAIRGHVNVRSRRNIILIRLERWAGGRLIRNADLLLNVTRHKSRFSSNDTYRLLHQINTIIDRSGSPVQEVVILLRQPRHNPSLILFIIYQGRRHSHSQTVRCSPNPLRSSLQDREYST